MRASVKASNAKPLAIRDRIIELRRVPASDLMPNPANFRLHNEIQRQHLQATLQSIGFAGAELARVLPDGRLMLIDGHLRAEEMADAPIPVLVTDLDEAEADALLATFDPIGRLAGTDQNAARALLERVSASGHHAAADLLRAVSQHDQTAALLESLADGMLGQESHNGYAGQANSNGYHNTDGEDEDSDTPDSLTWR